MNISLRERIFIIIGLCFLVPILIYLFVIGPINTLNETTSRKIKTLVRKNTEIQIGKKQIDFYRSSMISSNTLIDSILRNIVSDMGLAKDSQIGSLSSGNNQKKYKLTLNEIRNDQLMSIVYRIENNTPVLKINKLLITRSFRDRNKKIKVEIEIIG